jgi:hypothetical protein
MDALARAGQTACAPSAAAISADPTSAPGPELRKHLGAIQAGNRLDREWMSDERFDEIVSFCGIVASHCTSAAEAAWRRDQALTGTHLRHAREGLMLALKTFNVLPVGGRAV